MKFFWFFMMLGAVGGVPLGAYVHALYSKNKLLLQGKTDQNRCSGQVGTAYEPKRCPSPKSTTCVDSLCPMHCRDIHRGKCQEKFL